jgi:hypothetical protein
MSERWTGGWKEAREGGRQEKHEKKMRMRSSGKTEIHGEAWVSDSSHKVETLKKVEEEKEQEEEKTERKMRKWKKRGNRNIKIRKKRERRMR